MIKMEIEREFLKYIALQQIHITRKILAEEAKLKGMKYFGLYKINY